MLILGLVLTQGITLALVAWVLNRVLYSRFARAMARLDHSRRENEERTLALEAKIKETDVQFQKKMNESKDRADKILERAEAEAEQIRARGRAAALEETERILAKVHLENDKLTRELVSQVNDQAALIAAEAIRHLFQSKIDRPIHHWLFEELVREFEAMDALRSAADLSRVTVVSAFALSADEEAHLARAIEHKLKRGVERVTQIDPALLAGIVLKIGDITLDGSIRSRIQTAVVAAAAAAKGSKGPGIF